MLSFPFLQILDGAVNLPLHALGVSLIRRGDLMYSRENGSPVEVAGLLGSQSLSCPSGEGSGLLHPPFPQSRASWEVFGVAGLLTSDLARNTLFYIPRNIFSLKFLKAQPLPAALWPG